MQLETIRCEPAPEEKICKLDTATVRVRVEDVYGNGEAESR